MKLNMRIGARILAGYGLGLAVAAGIGIVSYRSTAELVDSADWVTHTHQVKESIFQVRYALKEIETDQLGFLLTGDQHYLEANQASVQSVDRYVRDLQELTRDNPNQQRRLAVLASLTANRPADAAEIVAVRKQGGEREAAQAILSGKGKNADEIRRLTTEVYDEEELLLKRRDQTLKQTAHFAMNAIIFGGLLVVALLSVIGYLLQRSITRPLSEFLRFVGRVGGGDLTQRAKASSADELGDLARGLDQMVVGLKDVAGQARFASENLTAAAAEILASTQQQASGTAEQAASLQQTTTTMEEVTQSGMQISERAKQVATAVEANSVASLAGLAAVENTTRTMEAIREQAEAVAENVVSLSAKTQTIGEIISTVNDVAEQSHLLALNAAIEAAAAGEHGRSFSVIAGEVKNLADQSREATVQVRSILGDIQKGINSSVMLTEEAVKRVDSGKQQAEMANRTIREMSENIQQSVQAFQQIVAGSNQQQIGFKQVMQAVRDIGQASQQSAASTRLLEKGAVNLAALAQQLQKAVERYQI